MDSLLVSFLAITSLALCVQGQDLFNDGDLRLVSNSGTTGGASGRLEVYYSFQWGTVCDDLFELNDAIVACRQLGFVTSITYDSVGSLGYNEASSTTPTWLDNLGCSGTESRLIDCSHRGVGIEDCSHVEDIGLVCFGEGSTLSPTSTVSPFTGQNLFNDGDLRLVSNSGTTGGASGRLEVYYDFQWGTVCDDFFELNDAIVACRQLGLVTSITYDSVGSLGYNQASSSTRTWLDNLGCSGMESRLIDCSHNGFGNEDCSHVEDIGLVCFGEGSTLSPTSTVSPFTGQDIFYNGDLRLVSNSGTTGGASGRLEVYYNLQWGTVCDGLFDLNDAIVACRQLGFVASITYNSVGSLGYNEASSSTRIWLDNLGCSGTESRLIDCSHRGVGIEDCNHAEDIGLVCFGEAITVSSTSTVSPFTAQGDIRLVGYHGYTGGIAGRVEVYYNSRWVTVCDSTIEKAVPDVVCRQLGFNDSAYFGDVDTLNYATVSSSFPYLANVFCSGSESRLEDCSHRAVLSSLSCSHSNDLAVICKGTSGSSSQAAIETGSLRLNTEGVDNPRSFSGRLEVFANGQWGTVCDDGFGLTEANSACRQLGFVEALYYDTVGVLNLNQPSNNVPILLDGVGCRSGSPPPRLIDCSHNGVGVHDCSHNEDIGLVCLGVGSLRLVGTTSSTSFSRDEGRLEVYVNGQWGTVCDDFFDQMDADVACRQLGFSHASNYDNVGITSSYSTSPPIWLDDLDCRSDDDFLLLCNHRGIGVDNCGHTEDIQLSCTKFSSAIAIAIGVVIPTAVIIIIVIVVCCCYQKRKKRTNRTTSRPLTRTVQPSTTAITATTRAAYPMQAYPTAPPQAYPVQQPATQPGYSAPQGSAYPTQHQQPPSGYPAPYPAMQQQPPAPYPTMQQQPPAPYTSVQQQPPAPYTSVQQNPPAPYPSAQPQTVYPPAEPVKSDLYTDAPPPYPGTAAELAAYPTYQPSGYPQTDVYPPPQ